MKLAPTAATARARQPPDPAATLASGRRHAAQWHFAQKQSDSAGGRGDDRGNNENRLQRSR